MAKQRSPKKPLPGGPDESAEPPGPDRRAQRADGEAGSADREIADRERAAVSGDEPELGFETAVAEIETIVRGLESGDWSLTESLTQYERAVGRLQNCHRMLESAQQRVTLLSGFDAEGNPVTEPLDARQPAEGAGGDPETLERKRRSRGASRGLSPNRRDDLPDPPSGPKGVSDDPTGEGGTDQDEGPGLF